MSRRLRTENQAVQQLKTEVEEENYLQIQKAKIFAPTLWAKLATGYKIQDLQPQYFDEVMSMILTDYVNTEVLCRNVELKEDEESLNSFCEQTMFYMKDGSSIAIFDETNDHKLAGVLLLRVVSKLDYGRVFGRYVFNKGEAMKKIFDIRSVLIRKNDIYDMYNCDVYLEYHLVCIRNEYRNKNMGYQLMRCGLEVARTLKIPVIVGLFSAFSLQKAAKRLNFTTIQEVRYTSWRDENDLLIIDDPGAGNYSFVYMGCIVPPVEVFDPQVIKVLTPGQIELKAELDKIPPPRTRVEKRNEKNKDKNK